jgi:serine protease Do
MRSPLLLLLVLGAAVPACRAQGKTAEEANIFGQFADRIEEVVRTAEPYLFRVIRPHSGEDPVGPSRVLGTGIAVGSSWILTTAGVVGPASEVLVLRGESDTLRARVLGVDRRTDVALLEVRGLDTPAIPVASSSLLFPGDPVAAVGLGPRPGVQASFGLVVLAEGPRLGFSETDVLQVSAPTFPGITGGALLNLRGELVGLVFGRTALDPGGAMLPPGTSLVAGFLEDGHLTTVAPTSAVVALPASIALDIVRELGEHGQVQRGYLGLQVELVQMTKMKARPLPGVLVRGVVPASPAEEAVLLPGDVILEYAGAKVRSPENLSYLVAATIPGSEVPLLVLRRGARIRSIVRIAQAPESAWDPALDEVAPTAASAAGIAPAVR